METKGDEGETTLSFEETFEDFQRSITTNSINKRKHIFQQLTDVKEFANESYTPQIIQLIFETLNIYDDATSTQVVEKAIAHFAKESPKFITSFFARWQKACNQLGRTTSHSQHYRKATKLFSWSCVLVSSCTKDLSPLVDNGNDGLLSSLIMQQAFLIGFIAGGRNTEAIQSSFIRLKLTFKKQPNAFDVYLKTLSGADLTHDTALITGFLFEHGQTLPSVAALKGKFVEWYIKAILASPTVPRSNANPTFRTLIRALTAEEISKQILPQLNRVLKRSPENILSSVTYLFHNITADISIIAEKEILQILIPSLRSSNDVIRNETVSAVGSLFSQIKDSELPTALQQITKIFKEKPPSWFERAGISLALEQVALHHQKNLKVGELAAIALTEQLEAENNDDARCVEFKVLSKWLQILPSYPEKSLKLLTTGLNSDKENIRAFVLDCLFNSLEKTWDQPEKLSKVVALLPSILKVVKNSKGTGDGILAAALLARLSTVDSSIDAKMNSEKIWSTFFKADANIYKAMSSSKLKEKELVDLANLLAIVLKYHTNKIADVADGLSTLCFHLLDISVHSSWNVRSSTLQIIKSVHAINTTASNSLISAFAPLLKQYSQSASQQNSSEKEGEETAKSSIPAPKIFAKALMACVSPGVKVEVLPLLFTQLSHPFVSDTIGRTRVLHENAGKLLQVSLKDILEKNADSICAYLEGEKSIGSDDPLIIQSGVNCVQSIVQIAPDAILPPLIAFLESFLSQSKTEYANLTADDIGIYNTPEGTIYDVTALEAAKTETEKKVGNVSREKKKRGEHGMYTAEDQKWEAELRKELEKKKQGGSGSGAETLLDQKLRDEQLKREHIVREKVTRLVTRIISSVRAIAAIAKGNPVKAHDYLPTFNAVLLPLLEFALFQESTTSALRGLALTLHGTIRSMNQYIAQAVVILHTPPFDEDFFGFVLDNSMPKLVEATKGSALSGASFSFIFPLVDAAFTKGMFSLPTQENSMLLLERHTRVAGIPRAKVVQVLLHVIGNFPRYQQRACDALIAVAQSIAATDEFQEIFKGIVAEPPFVRLATLKALEVVPNLATTQALPSNGIAYLWISTFDTESENAQLAKRVFELASRTLEPSFLNDLEPFISSSVPAVQPIVAHAIAGAIKQHPSTLEATLTRLFQVYRDNVPKKPEIDPATMSIHHRKKETSEDEEELPEEEEYNPNRRTRAGIALTLGATGPLLTAQGIHLAFDFLLSTGLFDHNDDVRQKMIQAGLDIINEQGQASSSLLPLFEEFLSKPSTNRASDRVRESAVIFLGTVARHLEPENPKVMLIVEQLMETLKTPSESVQRAVSTCLIPLFANATVQSRAEETIANLLSQLQSPAIDYGERRGAAFGLAGVVKGLGIPALKKFDIVAKLQASIEDKKHPSARLGALLAFECLCNTLQRLFEPYVIQILPKLLVCFGDSVADVREAVVDTSRVIMSQLSAHGVKLVLPALLKALDDRSNWKTKKGSIELLGSMAFCAPRQLSSCLPMIVPRLSAVLTDTHAQVQEAAKEALEHIGSVIRNPEIQMHVPILLKAVDDPDLWTRDALDALIHTNFVHSIDAASLSLIVPVLHRGNKDRSIETKKKAAQIVGNMCSLTEHKDLEPYIDMMIEDLKTVVIDPIPEVRAIAAKALGSLNRGMSEDIVGGLINWLLDTMKSEAGNVERSGAAQGLSEVLAGLDISRLEGLLPDILSNSNHMKAHIREGAIGLFVFLPATMTADFQNYLDQTLPAILRGLSDETESVRDISLRAGQSIVNQYAQTSLALLLPALETGLFDDSWRIRQSSVQLLGDLLYHVVTKSPNPEQEAMVTLTNTLGMERRNKILAALYLIRSDVSSIVRQKALLVWKSVVTNTPKTLREILNSLMASLIECLGSSNLDKRQVGGKTLGDLVQKLGEKILPEIIPILEKGLDSNDADTRQGVCIGLSEVMASTSRHHLAAYSNVLIPAVRKALCDELEDVQEAAAQAFDTLHNNIGNKALDEILPPMLAGLQDPNSHALDGLRQILAVKSSVVLPFLVPKLLTPPITAFNVQALASIAEVSGSALNQHLVSLIPALLGAIAESAGNKEDVRTAAETIVLAVQLDGVNALFAELMQHMKNSDSATIRAEAAYLIGSFAKNTEVEIEPEFPALLGALLARFNDENAEVQKAAWTALGAVVDSIRKDNQPNYIPEVRNILERIREELEKKNRTMLPGFNLPKGIQPLWPMFSQGIMTASPELREQAALGLGDILRMTSDEALKPFYITITGPLIRIIGDRFNWQVKAAILQTIHLVIQKGGVMLKPFVPQLQTTFLKSLQDPTRAVRVHAADALGTLVAFVPKLDSLITELLNGIGSAEGGIQETMLTALQKVLLKAGAALSPEVAAKVGQSLLQLLESDEDNIRSFAAKSLGAYSKSLSAEQLERVVSSLLKDTNAPWQLRHGYCLALKSILYHSPAVYTTFAKQLANVLLKYATDDKVSVRQSACETIGRVILIPEVGDWIQQYLSTLSTLAGDSVSDIKIAALKAIKRFSKQYPFVAREHLSVLIPPLMSAVKDRLNFPVKLAAERALLYALQINTNPKVVDEYVSTLDTAQARAISDYAKRVLTKLAQESDSDEDHE